MSAMQPGRPGPVPAPPARIAGWGTDAANVQVPEPDAAEPDGLQQRPLAEHAERFARLHTELQAALADIDNA